MIGDINRVLMSLGDPGLFASADRYQLNDANRTVCSLTGKVVSIIGDTLVKTHITDIKNNEGTERAYRYFKYFQHHNIKKIKSLPSALTQPEKAESKTNSDTITPLIQLLMKDQLSYADCKTLKEKILADYRLYNQPESSQPLVPFQQLNKKQQEAFISQRIAYWKYHLAGTFKKDTPVYSYLFSQAPQSLTENEKQTTQSLIMNSLIRYSTQEELRQNTLIKQSPTVCKDPKRTVYRVGQSDYEKQKAKAIKLGQPSFDLQTVNQPGTKASYGPALYTYHGQKIITRPTPDSCLEISTKPESGLLQLNQSFLFTGKNFEGRVDVVNGKVAHPLIGCHAGSMDPYLMILSPDYIKGIKAFDSTSTTKIDVGFTPEDIRVHGLSQKVVPTSSTPGLGWSAERTVIDPAAGTKTQHMTYKYAKRLNPTTAKARGSKIENKYYITKNANELIRIKPAVSSSATKLESKFHSVTPYEAKPYETNPYRNFPFVISYGKNARNQAADAPGCSGLTDQSTAIDSPHINSIHQSPSNNIEVLKSLIHTFAGDQISASSYQMLHDKLVEDYVLIRRSSDNRLPDNLDQLTHTQLKQFAEERFSYWKYHLAGLFPTGTLVSEYLFNNQKTRFDQNDVQTATSTIARTLSQYDTARELKLNTLIHAAPRLINPPVNTVYRAGSTYEIEKAKRLKLNQPAFDLPTVNQPGAAHTHGKGLYTAIRPVDTDNFDKGCRMEIHMDHKRLLQAGYDPLPVFTNASHRKVHTSLSLVNDSTQHPLFGSRYEDSREYVIVLNPSVIKSIKTYDSTFNTKIDLGFTAEDIARSTLTQKTVSPANIKQRLTPSAERVIFDPATHQQYKAPTFEEIKPLSTAIRQKRGRKEEAKYYLQNRQGQFVRIKPMVTRSTPGPYRDHPFAITYSKKRNDLHVQPEVTASTSARAGAAITGLRGITATDKPSCSQYPEPVEIEKSISPVTAATNKKDKPMPETCDICLDSLVSDSETESLIKLPDGSQRHQGCHNHFLQHNNQPKPENVISGSMSWSVQKSSYLRHIEQADPQADGVIVVQFNLQAPEVFEGQRLDRRTRNFTHYMPNSPVGRQILAALKTAFDQGKVQTIAQSNTENLFGLCYTIHFKTQARVNTAHGYPCETWDRTLINGLLDAGIDVDMENTPNIPPTGQSHKKAQPK